MKNLIIGDIHSSYDRLRNVLEKADFDKNNDNLYSTGDLCDRGRHPVETLKFLMGLPHFLPVAGNHDLWLYDALRSENPDEWWTEHNGGDVTWTALAENDPGFRKKVMDWIGGFPLVRMSGRHIILHGGPGDYRSEQDLCPLSRLTVADTWLPQDRYGGIRLDPRAENVCWDREYIRQATGGREPYRRPIPPFETTKTIICGHTPLNRVFHSDAYHITCIDTGSFVRDGHITVMNIDTGEFFQSDN